jgi:uncharacterized protein YggE
MSAPLVHQETSARPLLYTAISVHGSAQRVISPDSVVLAGYVQNTDVDGLTALDGASRALDELVDQLRLLGGHAASAANTLDPLVWSAYSTDTSTERIYQDHGWVTTGRVTATVRVSIVVRDFSLLDVIGLTLAGVSDYRSSGVRWSVDTTNPAWAAVRADAVRGALAKARDYAAAVGGTVVRLDHLADAGLLNGAGAGSTESHAVPLAGGRHGAPDGDTSAPSLDPVPQTVTATVDARVIATVPELGDADR